MIFSREDRKVNLSLSAKIAVLCSAVALILVSAGLITLDALSASVTVKNGGSLETKVFTFKNTVEDVLSEQGISLNEGDKTNFALKENLYDDMTIEVYRAIQVYVTANGETKKISTTKRVAEDILVDAGYELTEDDDVLPRRERIAKADDEIVLVKNTVETVTLTEATPYPKTEKPNETLSRGVRKIVERGKKGQSEITYKISYSDGVETGREVISEKVIIPAKEEIVEVGTKKANLDDYTIAYNGTVTTSRSGALSYSRAVTCNATAYDAVSCGKQPGTARTATGIIATRGVIAVDPSFIPLGTRVYVEGYGYAIAADTGGAIKGNIIDLFMDTTAEALQWGRRNVKVYILN
ncbi:MAG: G5 domain-containing protein [Clostridia bacterium]|nr:G5 domain-containing protein [Clostridia bacterium]